MTAADRQRLRLAVDARRRQLVKLPPQPESVAKQARRRSRLAVVTTHSRAGYNSGCRCNVCCAAHRVYNTEWSRQRRAAS